MLLENTCFRSSPALSSGKHKRVLWIFSEQTGLSLLATTAGTAFSATLTPRPTMSQASCLTISTGRYQKMVCQQVHLHQTAHPVPILTYSPAVWCGALKFPNASSYNQFKPSRLLATRLACTDNIVACWFDVRSQGRSVRRAQVRRRQGYYRVRPIAHAHGGSLGDLIKKQQHEKTAQQQ